jgi:hypothetical protein
LGASLVVLGSFGAVAAGCFVAMGINYNNYYLISKMRERGLPLFSPEV